MNSYAEAPSGLILIANGIDPVLRWDALASAASPAGIPAPATALTLAASGTGGISGTYYAYVRFVDADGNVSNFGPVSAAAVATLADTITYTSVPTSDSPRVYRRQILRNTTGQAATFYVDVDTTDLTSTTFTSTLTDTALQTQEAVPLFDPDSGLPFANRHGLPPSHKSVLAHHLDRMFLACEVPYTTGAVSLATGSTTATGIGTDWPATLAGRWIFIDGSWWPYEIEAVDVANQTLTLNAPYRNDSDAYAAFAIQAAPGERRLVYFTEAGLPESWPAANTIALTEDGDTLTGLMSMRSFLYLLERRHIYRFTFQNSPSEDGFIFLSTNRGCLNNRCWVVVEDAAYLMDEMGVHKFTGGEDEAISIPIQDLWEVSHIQGEWRINWDAAEQFHATHYPGQQVIRWFVSLSGDFHPRHALAFDYRANRWWIEEYPFGVGASAVARMEGRPWVFLGGPAARVYAFAAGPLDCPHPADGDTRGTVTAATSLSLTDSAATWPSTGLIGAPAVIVSGRGAGQLRRIASVAGTTLRLVEPWTIVPDTTSVYQLGGVEYQYRSGWFRFLESEEETPRRLELLFDPVAQAAFANLRLYLDRNPTALAWDTTYTSDEASGVASTAGNPDLVVDLTKAAGFGQKRLDGRRDFYLDGPRFVQIGLDGVGGEDAPSFKGITLDGAM